MSKRDLKDRIHEQDTEYLVGRNVLVEALKSERTFKKIFIEENLKNRGYSNDSRVRDIINIAQKRSIPLEAIQGRQQAKIEQEVGVTSEGVIGLVEKRERLNIQDLFALCTKKNKEPFFIVINNLLYEENLGAILRSASAGGVDGLILPKRDAREVNANVARISMGGSEHVPVIKANLFEALDMCKKEGMKIVGVELSGSHYYYDEKLSGPLVFVLGGEDAGISAPLLKRCDSVVKIPMLGQVQSLNVSVSTGIVIYEKIRQECQN